MVIDNNLPAVNHDIFALGKQKGKPVVAETKVSTEHLYSKLDLKEVAAGVVQDARAMGEFKDKKGLEETTDLQVGPDIRYALTSTNLDYLKRIRWGPLTVGEYREVQYRIRELESKFASSSNILDGQLIDIG
ncbi:MAG: hypothetical protein H8D96_04800 [Desulfobacterales bacterium]|uniref:Uncharacterized protein n=1 Tax=Candidatus Desulfatibia vada TaxID=2841696 RepID=A0A8J6NSJ9_9BACT|nr:hypothetical protein [Candidatus Desulfatibia vada]MBL6971859.1 hypothetical protein [Desulfobacterales bacterium]